MRVIITGGTGNLGRPLAARLVEAGHEVIVLSRDPEGKKRLLPQAVRLERWDGRTAQGWGRLADGAWAIINFAGENIGGKGLAPPRWNAARKQRFYDSRVNAGRAVLQAIEQAAAQPRLLVQASAVGYYGPNPPGEVSEDSPPGDDFLARLCADWEASTAPAEELGVRRVVIRTGIVLDARHGPLPRMALPARYFFVGAYGGGGQWMPWIHLEDEMRAVQFLMEQERAQGPFNLTAPNPVTNAEFTRALGKVLRRPAVIPAPAWPMRLALGEVATLVLDGQRAVPRRLLELGFDFRFPEIEGALHDLLA